MSRTHAPSGWVYRTHDPEHLHELLWDGFEGEAGWDIGANEGQSVDRMVRSFRHVIALEPAIESFRILQGEWGDREGVTLLNMAAGRESGMLAASVRSVPMKGGQLTAPWIPDDGWHGPELYQRSVPCITLDELTSEYGLPDFVKIDTEGYEAEVLAGAGILLDAGCDWLVEYHSVRLRDECTGLLRDSGLRVQAVEGPGDGIEVNGWILAKRSEEG